MSSYTTLLSDGIGLTIATLYSLAGQAHFTPRLTPGLAQNIEIMTHNSHAAFWFLGLDYLALRRIFGAFDLIGAACLWRKKTRKVGLIFAVFGFSGGFYGQLYTGGDVLQVGGLLSMAVVGLLCSSDR
ncbi:uncharacterized protein LTR77_009244 [Saxophila tyrrhenica]|uniref:Uncharacterized protein n=1 Tax=Saxophila tyrrhenica TaxID=1690608 RepID=A0AAV9NYW1_9PEZI|nr:hypothetical protein LTR77_009244 [Saxophila tyrrhenica]